MARTTILTCHGCRKPVGHTGKSDAVVHVSYHDIYPARQAQLEWENKSNTAACPACEKPAIKVQGVGRFHVDGSDNRACANVPSSPFSTITGEMLASMPEEAVWAVHCDGCNPHGDGEGGYCGGCYWFDAQRMRTWEQAVSWSAHLSEKDWLEATNWADFLRSLSPVDA